MSIWRAAFQKNSPKKPNPHEVGQERENNPATQESRHLFFYKVARLLVVDCSGIYYDFFVFFGAANQLNLKKTTLTALLRRTRARVLSLKDRDGNQRLPYCAVGVVWLSYFEFASISDFSLHVAPRLALGFLPHCLPISLGEDTGGALSEVFLTLLYCILFSIVPS